MERVHKAASRDKAGFESDCMNGWFAYFIADSSIRLTLQKLPTLYVDKRPCRNCRQTVFLTKVSH